MAMAQLCIDIAASHHPLHILTVDHGLRSEAKAEAAQVAAWAQSVGVAHHILTWAPTGDEGANNNQHEQARMARYGLMADWCAQNDVRHILTAHHQDDQAETVLMRLGRGSGVDGLSAMRGLQKLMTPSFVEVNLLRPLLGVPKQALEQFAKQQSLPTVDDPSNQADRYMRARHRHFLSGAEAEAMGLTAARLADTARVMQRAADALDQSVDELVAACVIADPMGFLHVCVPDLADAADEVRLRLLRRLIGAMNPGSFPVEEAQLMRLWNWISGRGDDADAPRYTIRGLLFERSGTSDAPQLFIMREPRGMAAGRQITDIPFLWDGRFRIDPSDGQQGDLWCLAASTIGLGKLRESLSKPQADLINACPPMARGTVPVLARLEGDTDGEKQAVALSLLTQQFVPRLTAKAPLVLPEMG